MKIKTHTKQHINVLRYRFTALTIMLCFTQLLLGQNTINCIDGTWRPRDSRKVLSQTTLDSRSSTTLIIDYENRKLIEKHSETDLVFNFAPYGKSILIDLKSGVDEYGNDITSHLNDSINGIILDVLSMKNNSMVLSSKYIISPIENITDSLNYNLLETLQGNIIYYERSSTEENRPTCISSNWNTNLNFSNTKWYAWVSDPFNTEFTQLYFNEDNELIYTSIKDKAKFKKCQFSIIDHQLIINYPTSDVYYDIIPLDNNFSRIGLILRKHLTTKGKIIKKDIDLFSQKYSPQLFGSYPGEMFIMHNYHNDNKISPDFKDSVLTIHTRHGNAGEHIFFNSKDGVIEFASNSNINWSPSALQFVLDSNLLKISYKIPDLSNGADVRSEYIVHNYGHNLIRARLFKVFVNGIEVQDIQFWPKSTYNTNQPRLPFLGSEYFYLTNDNSVHFDVFETKHLVDFIKDPFDKSPTINKFKLSTSTNKWNLVTSSNCIENINLQSRVTELEVMLYPNIPPRNPNKVDDIKFSIRRVIDCGKLWFLTSEIRPIYDKKETVYKNEKHSSLENAVSEVVRLISHYEFE